MLFRVIEYICIVVLTMYSSSRNSPQVALLCQFIMTLFLSLDVKNAGLCKRKKRWYSQQRACLLPRAFFKLKRDGRGRR